jgi:hypothetical protein
MNTLEDRVRAALRAHAEDFSADPDAWTRIRARSRAAGTRRGGPRWSRLSRFLIPAAAAAAVVAVVVGVTVAVSGITVRPAGVATERASGTASARPRLSAPSPLSLLQEFYLKMEPPSSAILTMRLPATSKPATAYFWLAYNSPAYWLDQIDTQIQLCHVTFNLPDSGGSGFCWPLPDLPAGRLAIVTGNEGAYVGDGQNIIVGAAAAQVRSVAAVLPDGRVYPGTIGTGRGFPYQAWAVGYPSANGVRLVFRDAAGHEIASLSPAAPNGPQQIPQPRSGGVPVFRYNGGDDMPSGTMLGYLIDGRVGFWSQIWGGEISQVPANGEPVLAGLLNPFGQVNGRWQTVEAFGYAHANVVRVVLHLPDGRNVTTSTVAAGWAGSDLRLWEVALPSGTWVQGKGMPTVTATGEDAAGHVLGRVQLGGME